MKRFKDLFISCSKDQAQAFFSRLTSYLSSSCPDGWQIDDDRMKRFADGICFVSGLFSCVVRFDGNKNPYAMVSLVYSEDEHRIWISNIVPCQTSQLSMDEYNEVLVKFASEIVDPVKLDLTCVITKDEFTGKDVMPEASWQKLESFDEYGEYICIARKDAQIKHMGHRIELGDIEVCASALEYVSECCCLYAAPMEKIVLFCGCDADKKRQIRKDLSAKLPKYMLPHDYVCFDELPHNRNGKIDRAGLLQEWIKNNTK